MKKIYFALLIVFSFSCLNKLFAQPNPPSPVCWGPLLHTTGPSYNCSIPALINFYTTMCHDDLSDGDTLTFFYDFGDGEYDTLVQPVFWDPNTGWGSANPSLSHTYDSAGIYYPTVYITTNHPGLGPYTQQYPISVRTGIYCGAITGIIYHDCNNDCTKGIQEPRYNNVKVVLIDSTNTRVDSMITNGGGYYNFLMPLGNHFTLETTAPYGLNLYSTCYVGGVIADSLTTGPINLNIGFPSSQSNDLAPMITSEVIVPGQPLIIKLSALNAGCSNLYPGEGILKYDTTKVTFQFLMSGPPLTILDGDSIYWNAIDFVNNGALNEIYARFIVTPNVQPGDSLCFSYRVGPDTYNPSNNEFQLCQYAVDSFAPKMKQVSPNDQTNQGMIDPNATLIYTVHFQNTGLSTMHNMRIIDTLDANLDASSFELLATSHKISQSRMGQVVEFFLDNDSILSSFNIYHLSQGSIVYSVKTNSGLNPGTEIRNTAYISFNQQPFESTNSTLNTINGILNMKEVFSNSSVQTIPNPFNESLTLINQADMKTNLEVFNILGEKIVGLSMEKDQQLTLPTGEWTPGVYLLLIRNSEGVKSSKLIKK